MQRRDFCRLIGLAAGAAYLPASPLVAQLPTKPIPKLEPLRTIEIEPENDTAEPPVLTAVAISPDGKLVAAAGDDHFVRLWNLADGTELAEWKEHNDWVRAVAFSPSGKQLLTAADDHLTNLWNLSTGTIVRSVEHPAGVVHRGLFLPDGKHFVTSGFDAIVRIYETETGALKQELTCSADDVRALTVTPNSTRLAAAGRDGVIRIWNLKDYKQVAEVPAHRMRIRVLQYSPDGSQLLSAADDRKFFLWRGDGTREATLPPPPGRLMCAAFLNNEQAAVGGSDNIIRILDLPSRRELTQLVGHSGSIAALEHHPETGLLASSSFDTTVRLWKPAGGGIPSQVTRKPMPATTK